MPRILTPVRGSQGVIIDTDILAPAAILVVVVRVALKIREVGKNATQATEGVDSNQFR